MDDDLDLESLEADDSSSSDSASSQQEEMSWEVLDCSDSDSRPASDAALTPLSKQPSDSGDWILQPDNDRDAEGDDACLPVIESITSLSALDDEKTDLEHAKETRSGQSRPDDFNLSGDDSDRLIIDTSATTTDLENSATSGKATANNSEKGNENSAAVTPKEPTTPAKQNGVEADEQSVKSKSSNDKEQTDEEEENNGQDDNDGFNLVISAVQGSAKTTDDAPSETSDTAKSSPLPEDNPPTSNTNGGTGEDAVSKATVAEEQPKKHVIVIDPDGSGDAADSHERIHFKPGIIKLEPGVPASSGGASVKKSTAKSNAPMVVTFAANSNQASLTGGTTLSTATMQQAGMLPVQSTANMNIAYQAFQQQYQFGSRTILKSPPRKTGPGALPQVLVRHGGPRTRPAYIRLGSQTLQQFARLSGPNQAGIQTNQQRMISVLMDRGAGVTTANALPHNFSQLLQAGPPGTLVNTGGPGGNPVKVLILPSQSSSASPMTQSNVHCITSTTPPMYSVTTSGGMGALSSVGNLAGGKGNITKVPSTPDLKSASQILPTSAATKQGKQSQNTGPKTQGSGKGKSQSSTGKTGGSKGQSAGKTSKIAPKDSGAADTDSLMQNLTSTEERLKRRLLSKTNLIKEYHPSLTSGLGHISFEFYSCHGCRDVFVNKSSLEYHRNRQSMCITYNCDPCKHVFTFPNKCQFRCHMLKHVQELKLIHKNLLERITVRPTQYSASKSKNQQRDTSQSVEDVDIVSVDSPIDINAPHEPSPLSFDTNPEKDTDRLTEPAEAAENGSSLGLTIASVSSVSLGDHQEVPGVPPLTSPIKATVAQLQSSQPPSLTIASIVPPVAAPPPHVTPALPGQPKTITVDLTQMGPTINQIGQSKPDRTKPDTKPIAPAETRPDPDIEQIPPVTSPGAKASSLPPPVQSTDGGNIFCTECNLTFSSYMKLQRHYNDADKPHPLRPPCCNVRLATECCVRAHMRTHQQQRPYVCSDCGECFRGELAIFRKHTYNCKRVMHSAVIVFPCPRCQSWFSKIDELRNHVRKVHSESYLKCNLCPMAFKSIASFTEHNTNKHPGEKTDSANFTSIYKCPLCDSVFHDQRMKLDHLEQHINNIYANQRVSFVCQLCKKLCYNYAMMRYHLKEKHMVTALGNMCDLCGVDSGPTIKHLVAHQRKVHNSFPANMLIDPFTKSIDEKGSDNETAAGGKTPGADIIPLDSGNGAAGDDQDKGGEDGEGAYHGNLQRSSSMYSQSIPKPDENGQGEVVEGTQQVRCHICQQKFNNRKDLVRHKKADHGMMKRKRMRGDKSPEEEPKKVKQDEDLLDETTPQLQVRSDYLLRFECDDCDYRTPTFQDLQQHQAAVHGIEARFPCLLCGVTFHTMGTLDDHMKSTHEGQIREYPYLCWICVENGQRKGYSKRAHLVRHFMNYHKIASKAIDSDRLDEMDRKAEMSEAEKLKTDTDTKVKPPKRPRIEGEDVFACVKCDFECKDRQEFQEHIAKHKKGGADSFQCPDCGMCFSVLPPLKNHLRLVHKIKNFNEYVEKSGVKLREPDKTKTPTKKSPGSAVADTSPTDKNPLECNVCYRVYQDQTALKNHMRSHGMAFIRSKRLAPLAFLAD